MEPMCNSFISPPGWDLEIAIEESLRNLQYMWEIMGKCGKSWENMGNHGKIYGKTMVLYGPTGPQFVNAKLVNITIITMLCMIRKYIFF